MEDPLTELVVDFMPQENKTCCVSDNKDDNENAQLT